MSLEGPRNADVEDDGFVTWGKKVIQRGGYPTDLKPVPPAAGAGDPVSHPPHYTQHPSGVECIQIVEHMSFCLGNVVKYVWRADLKGDALEDLRKARFYLDREIARRESPVSEGEA